jgi:hypothetical protein
MRTILAMALGGLGVFVLGGPVFGALSWAMGADVHVKGGAGRVVLDLVAGGVLLTIASCLLRYRPAWDA